MAEKNNILPANGGDYTAEKIKVLDDPTAVRKRPAM